MKRRTTRPLPPTFTTATLAADSIDAAARSVEAVVYSGARVARFPWFEDPHYLSLDVSQKAVNLERINAGVAPLLDSHNRSGVEAVIGRVEKAWLAAGEVRARLRFSKRPEVDGIWADVVDGILGALSVGVVLHEMEELPKSKGADADMRHFKATRWEIQEVSVVSVGADPAARIGLAEGAEHPCRVTLLHDGGLHMRKRKTCPSCSEKLPETEEQLETCPSCEADLDEAAAQREEMAREGEAHRLAAHFGLGEVVAQRWINDNLDADEMIRLGSAERARRAPRTEAHLGFGDDFDSPGSRLEAMAEAFAQRARGAEVKGPAQRYAQTTVPEAALEVLRLRGQRGLPDVRTYGGRQRVVEMALHTTSDFPQILGNTVNRLLLPAYESQQPTFRLIAARRPFIDFRAVSVVRAGDFPAPLQVNEHGEFKYGTMGESAETAVLLSYGRIFGITRQALVNDDLGAFSDLATKAAIRTADFLNARFFELLILAGAGLGPAMSDALTVYHATHANVTGAGALDNTRLGSARNLMMNQQSIDGIKLNVGGRFVLVSPASLTLAETFLAQIAPAQASNVNPFAGVLTALGDANLTGTRFYVLGDPARGSNYFYGGLAGQEGPRIDSRPGWEIDGVEIRLAIDQGFGVHDYRYGVSGAGA